MGYSPRAFRDTSPFGAIGAQAGQDAVSRHGAYVMWAQLIKTRLRAGHEGDLPRLAEELKKIEQADSGLIRSLAMQDQNDPTSDLRLS